MSSGFQPQELGLIPQETLQTQDKFKQCLTVTNMRNGPCAARVHNLGIIVRS